MCVLLERHNTLPRPVQIPYPDSQMSNASRLPSQRGWGGDKREENVEASNRLVHYYSPFNISVIHHPSTLNMLFIRWKAPSYGVWPKKPRWDNRIVFIDDNFRPFFPEDPETDLQNYWLSTWASVYRCIFTFCSMSYNHFIRFFSRHRTDNELTQSSLT